MTKRERNGCRWEDCSPGAIGELVQKQQGLDRRKILKTAGLASLTIIGGSGAIAYLWKRQGIPMLENGLTCSVVVANLHHLTVGRLAPDFAQEMRIHLANCPSCAQHLRDQFPEYTA